MLKLFVLFVAVPVLELYLLIQLGQQVGPGLTIGLVLVTGAVGMALAKSQGLAVLARLRQQLSQGEVPGAALLDGLFVLVGGAMLMTPGLITDTLGLLFLLPLTRAPIKAYLRRKFVDAVARGDTHIIIRRW